MKTIQWRLVILLSMFGFVMSIATVFWIPSQTEPLFWLGIFVVCALIIASQAKSKFFLHGFLTSIFNCIWITGAHVLFQAQYLANHQNEAMMMKNTPLAGSPILAMLIIGPIIGVVSGLILGLFSFAATYVVKRKKIECCETKEQTPSLDADRFHS